MIKSRKINKKAMFFTIIAIVLTVIIVFSIGIVDEYRLKNKMDVIETRITTINSFIKSVEDDLTRGLFISSFRSILALEQHITQTGTYIDDIDLRFEEALLNGTVNSTPIGIIENATFTIWGKSISDVASTIGIMFNMSVQSVSIQHIDPWNTKVEVNMTIFVEDFKKTASWEKSFTLQTRVDIYGFEDPLYLINSFGRVTNTIIQNEDTDFSDESNLKQHINNSWYIASPTGPNFLLRLEGNLSNSTYGIESIVNIDEFLAQEIPTKLKSDVDYIYFSDNDPSNCFVNETFDDPEYDWFRLDNDHLPTYSASCI